MPRSANVRVLGRVLQRGADNSAEHGVLVLLVQLNDTAALEEALLHGGQVKGKDLDDGTDKDSADGG